LASAAGGILESSALPLPNAAFKRVYSQYMVMNIGDKEQVYRAAFRVLRPGGHLVLTHLNAGPSGRLPTRFLPMASESAKCASCHLHRR
jgi:ubiquinone/menaquinone biosynthesis C-methylase UbiE